MKIFKNKEKPKKKSLKDFKPLIDLISKEEKPKKKIIKTYKYIKSDGEFIFNLGDYKEPPTRNQMIFFWTLNALDVYTTYEGLKKPNVYEKNPLLGDKPHLDNLLIQKAIVAGFISQNSNKNYITFMNTSLTFVVINNYKTMK